MFPQDDNDTLVSGHVNDSQSSHIEIRALFVRDGTVRFSYKVDAEPRYDGLTFYVDNVVKMNLTSNTNGFQLFSVDVRAGYHRFKWSYSKDFAIAEGEVRCSPHCTLPLFWSYSPALALFGEAPDSRQIRTKRRLA